MNAFSALVAALESTSAREVKRDRSGEKQQPRSERNKRYESSPKGKATRAAYMRAYYAKRKAAAAEQRTRDEGACAPPVRWNAAAKDVL